MSSGERPFEHDLRYLRLKTLDAEVVLDRTVTVCPEVQG